jgi:hypothetical protein
MVVAAVLFLCVIVAAYVFARRKRTKFNAEETARVRAQARRRWSKWLDGDKPEPPHDETWVEYQERKRRD